MDLDQALTLGEILERREMEIQDFEGVQNGSLPVSTEQYNFNRLHEQFKDVSRDEPVQAPIKNHEEYKMVESDKGGPGGSEMSDDPGKSIASLMSSTGFKHILLMDCGKEHATQLLTTLNKTKFSSVD